MVNNDFLEEIKAEYERLNKEKSNVAKEMSKLKENEIVKQYLELQDKMISLDLKQKELSGTIKKKQEYETCDHIWVVTSRSYDSYEGRKYLYHGCVKCGLDQRVLEIAEESGTKFFSDDDKLIYDVFKSQNYKKGKSTDIICDLELATAIYNKILEYYPNIDDDTAIKYLGIALDNIRNIEVSEERKMGRAKRLGLSKNFNRWSSSNV